MIAFDTNLLLRLVVRDDPAQNEISRARLAAAGEAGEPVFVGVVVLVESVWTLRSSYGANRSDIAAMVRGLLEESRFELESANLVEAALERFEKGRGDFADYLIAEIAGDRGARTTLTFDRTLRNEPGFTLAT